MKRFNKINYDKGIIIYREFKKVYDVEVSEKMIRDIIRLEERYGVEINMNFESPTMSITFKNDDPVSYNEQVTS
jgi:hypothetical protein